VRTGQVTYAKWLEKKGDVADRPTSFVDDKNQPTGYRLEKFKKK
jgi:hypothetical protein